MWGRTSAAGLGAAIAALALAIPGVAQAAAPGALDTTFGSGGLTVLDLKTQLNGAVVQPADGKLVVTGLSNGIDDPRLLVARYLPSGQLDSSFGSGGLATGPVPSGALGTIGEDVAIQADGKILVAGRVRSVSGAAGMQVVRYLPNGQLDGSFGSGGAVDFFRGSDFQSGATALAVKPSGEIVVGGQSSPGNSTVPTAAIARVSSGGQVLSGPHTFNNGEATVRSLAIQGDKTVVVGSEKQGQTILGFIARANADGSKDGSFASGGLVDQNLARNGAAGSALNDVAIGSSGAIVATGYAFDGAGGETPGAFAVTVRYDANGNTAGTNYLRAAKSSTVNTNEPGGGSVIIDNGGHIYTAGNWDESGSSALLANSQAFDGSLEAGFGTGGQVVVPFNDYAAPVYGRDGALSAAGLYIVGTSGTTPTQNNTTTRGIVARVGTFPFTDPCTQPNPPVSCGSGGGGGGGATALPPAKLQLLSSSISKGKLKLRVGATSLASGLTLTAKFQSGGVTSTYKLKFPTVSAGKPVVKSYTLTLKGKQKSKTTGIVTLSSPKTTKVRADELRLRVAKNAASLKRGTTKITGGKLVVSGTVSSRATGRILFRLDYALADGSVKSFNATATIKKGKWSLSKALPAEAAKSGGQLAIQYTGNDGKRIRGEQISKAVTP